MSRIGKLPIDIPAGVTVSVKDSNVTVKGPKGELTQYVNPVISVVVKDGVCICSCADSTNKENNSMFGLYRSLIKNMVVGVSTGYKKELELVGVGFRATNHGQAIEFSLGYSHNIFFVLPNEIKVETKNERNQNPIVILESCDKQLLGQVCAKIRSLRKPEPYKGKGIKFVGEILRRKAGKSAAAK